ncbi:MAG: hypothetical protein ACD_62C00015G0006 [uncultured bacterium]|nr:MAG: hypothetical protein ACD_62C00015G0006 [uncultured bacterium]
MFFKFLIVILTLHFLIKFIYKNTKNRFKVNRNGQQGRTQIHQPTTLCSCPACATFFYETQGVQRHGKLYCSELCAQKETDANFH